MESLNIKELIHAVRQELIESEEERVKKGIPPLFAVDNLKIEVNFVVEEKTETGGGLNLKIVDIGRDVTYSKQQIHKITLELKTCFIDNDLDKAVHNNDNGKCQMISDIKRDIYDKGGHTGMLPTANAD